MNAFLRLQSKWAVFTGEVVQQTVFFRCEVIIKTLLFPTY